MLKNFIAGAAGGAALFAFSEPIKNMIKSENDLTKNVESKKKITVSAINKKVRASII